MKLKKTLALAAILGSFAAPAISAHAAGPRVAMCGTSFVRQTQLTGTYNTDGYLKVWTNSCRNTVWVEVAGTGDSSCASIEDNLGHNSYLCSSGDYNVPEIPLACGLTMYTGRADANGSGFQHYSTVDGPFSIC